MPDRLRLGPLPVLDGERVILRERGESDIDDRLRYPIDLHTNAHAFLKGHRIMVQVQSTWFPVYDRNPQKFVPNIFEAHAADYVKATQRVYHNGPSPSAIVLPVITERRP